MKKNLLLLASIFVGTFAQAQETTEVTIPMQASYANQVYYKFSTNTQTPVTAASWDLAFQKAPGQMSLGAIRVNDGRSIEVYQAADAATGYATVDLAQEGTWTKLYNSETSWDTGAFDEGSAGFGWGEYNIDDHHVYGSIAYVLKYSATSYKKLIIEDYNPFVNTIAIKYATWDSATSTWGADQTYTVDNAALASGNSWTYVSLTTNDAVTVAPADADWDLVFRKYYGDVVSGGQTVKYNVTGALQNANVSVAKVDVAGTTSPAAPAAETYSEDINKVGDKWKVLNASFQYVMADQTFFLKYANGAIYRFYFTAFEGQSTGVVKFNSQNIATAGLEDVNSSLSFAVYPNPSADRNVTFVYDLKNASDNNTVSIYNLSGAKVFETEVTNNTGFYTKEVNLSNLQAGVYVAKIQAGNATATQKLILQ